MTFELSRFSSSSFQSFAQSLVLSNFGPGLQVFGSGPDGARDATFEGRPNYPSISDPWDGYTVVQVKFKTSPTNDHRDANWLVRAIRSERDKFLSPERKLRKPEFYLVVTNIKLSGIDGEPGTDASTKRVGGLSKVEAALTDFRQAIGCKSCHVWHHEKLQRLYECASDDLKKSYAAFTTPSDLLWKVLRSYEAPEVAEFLARAMAQDLRENRCTRLQEAGHSGAEGTLLTQVFVDLPYQREDVTAGVLIGTGLEEDEELEFEVTDYVEMEDVTLADDNSECEDGEEDTIADFDFDEVATGVVGDLLKHSSRIFVSSPENPHTQGRIVLLGGPGQGKSTVGQFVVQYLEAQILCAPNAPDLSYEAKSLGRSILTAAREEELPSEIPFRIPVRIALPAFADGYSKTRFDGSSTGRLTILDYVASHLSRLSNCRITTEDIRKWLKQHPWLFVLDGLDEVPPSGERQVVLNEIEALFDEIAAAKSNSLVIVSTRQQGYNRDLSPELWEHWSLTPLTSDEALRYAARLASARLSEPDKRERVLERLRNASENAATAPLMVTPLQVAILFTLVDLKGDVPTDRWNLFERYFSVLRDREEGKGGKYSDLLKKHRTVVEIIHQIAGFVLQAAAERSGRADSFLTKGEFEDLVSNTLKLEGHADDELLQLSAALTHLATNRLVLLASRVENRIAFDVRSLQEFMAAAMLTSCSDTLVQKRLRSIAGKSHWRHVFEIAASRCFSDTGKRHLSDFVIALCAELDAGSVESGDRLARSGSRLAIDLLVDGLGADSPKHRRVLFDRALVTLDLGPDLFDERLASIIDDTLSMHCIEAVRQRTVTPSRPGMAAWKLLAKLAQAQSEFALPAVREIVGNNLDAAFAFAEMCDQSLTIEDDFRAFVRDNVCRAGYEAVKIRRRAQWLLDTAFPESVFATQLSKNHPTISVRISGGKSSVAFALISITSSELYTPFLELRGDAKWMPMVAAAEFVRSPSPSTLSVALLKLAEYESLRRSLRIYMPWPIASILSAASRREDLEVHAKYALDGRMGNTEAWTQAEERWIQRGVSEDDIEYAVGCQNIFDDKIGSIGMPCLSGMPIQRSPRKTPHSGGQRFVEGLLSTINNGAPEHVTGDIHLILARSFFRYRDLSVMQFPDLTRALIAKRDVAFIYDFLDHAFGNSRELQAKEFNLLLECVANISLGTLVRVTRSALMRSRWKRRASDSEFLKQLLHAVLIDKRHSAIPAVMAAVVSDPHSAASFVQELERIAEYAVTAQDWKERIAALSIAVVTGQTWKIGMQAVREIVKLWPEAQDDVLFSLIAEVFLTRWGKDNAARQSFAEAVVPLVGTTTIEGCIGSLKAVLDSRSAGFRDRLSWTENGFADHSYDIYENVAGRTTSDPELPF